MSIRNKNEILSYFVKIFHIHVEPTIFVEPWKRLNNQCFSAFSLKTVFFLICLGEYVENEVNISNSSNPDHILTVNIKNLQDIGIVELKESKR